MCLFTTCNILKWMLFSLQISFVVASTLGIRSTPPRAEQSPALFHRETSASTPSPHTFKRIPETYTSAVSFRNGWTAHATTYTALLPIIPASHALFLFYQHILLHAGTFASTALARSPSTIGHGMLAGNLLRLTVGGLEIRFFSMNTQIPWGFVTSVVGMLSDNTRMGYTELHYGKFTHETGLVIFVTLTAVGFGG